MLITTTDIIQGREISSYLGLVTSRTVNAKAGIGKAGQRVAAQTVETMVGEITAAASELGADAVVGLKVFPEAMTMFAIGTAVKLA